MFFPLPLWFSDFSKIDTTNFKLIFKNMLVFDKEMAQIIFFNLWVTLKNH